MFMSNSPKLTDSLSWLLACNNLAIDEVIINISETIFKIERNSGVVTDLDKQGALDAVLISSQFDISSKASIDLHQLLSLVLKKIVIYNHVFLPF